MNPAASLFRPRNPNRLTVEQLEDRTVPALYTVTVLSPAAGDPGETAATHAGELRVNPALPTHDGQQIVGAATPADAIRAALTGTVSVSVGGQSASYSFSRATVGYSAAEHKPYFVEVAGTKGRVWLEDLASFSGSDWDYDDRSWRVSVRRLSGNGGSGGGSGGGGGGAVSTLSSVIDSGQFTWTNPFGETATADYQVTDYAPGIWLWQYTVKNNDLSTSSPPPQYGVGSVEVPAAAGAEVFDVRVESGVTDWHADPEYPFWYRDSYTGSYLAPGQTAVFTFKTPPVPIVPVTATAPVAARIPSIAEGPAKGPGVVPSGDLDLIDSAGNEVADDKEDDNPGPGGWVPVNNDNDNYNFPSATSLEHIIDSKEEVRVEGENDLIRIRVHDLVPAGNGDFTLNWTSPKIKVWRLSDKNGGQVTSGAVMTVGQPTDLYVEGLSLSTTALAEEIKLVWTGNNSVVDRVNLTVYEVTGAMNVPGHSRHTYYFKYPGPHRADARWHNVVYGGQYYVGIPPTTEGGYTTDGHVILWGEGAGAGQGYQIDMPNGFSVLRQVNVVKVEFKPLEGFSSLRLDGTLLGQNPADKTMIMSSTQQRANPSMTAEIRVVSVTGPNGRGVRFIDLGYIQTVTVANLHSDYMRDTPPYRMVSNLQGKTYFDSRANAYRPWYDKEQLVANPSWREMVGDGPLPANPTVFEMNDAPAAPATDSMIQKWTTPDGKQVEGKMVSFFSIDWRFQTYFCVHTRETANGADLSYTIRASQTWAWNGSGDVDATGTWQAGNMENRFTTPALTPNDPNVFGIYSPFVEVTNGEIVPWDLIKPGALRANDALVQQKFDKVNLT